MSVESAIVHRRAWMPRAGVARRVPKIATASGIFLVVMTVVAIAAPLIAPHNPSTVDLVHAYTGPNPDHLLGQDSAGRDVLSRLIYGTRLSLLGPLFVVLLAGVVGVPLGLAAGYSRGWLDGVLSRIFDLLFAFPALLLAILIVATFGTGFRTAVIAVAITYVPLMGRVVRAGALVECQKTYVDALKLQGFGPARICARHVAPNLTRLIVSQTAVYFGYALLDLAALSFLGLGTQPPSTDWGNMLADANRGIFDSSTGVIWPSIAIVALVVAVNLVADWVADRTERRA